MQLNTQYSTFTGFSMLQKLSLLTISFLAGSCLGILYYRVMAVLFIAGKTRPQVDYATALGQ